MRHYHVRNLAALLLAAVVAAPASAATIREITLKSKTLGEDRGILISTPAYYENGSDRYPLVILIDGERHTRYTSEIGDLYHQSGLPNIIIAGIVSTHRQGDFTPGASDGSAAASGNDHFLKFIEEELIPYMEAGYRTAPYRILIGHSGGGLFATYALSGSPGLFDAFICISPTLSWEDFALIEPTVSFLKKRDRLEGRLYLSLANEGGEERRGILRFKSALEAWAPEDLLWTFREYPDETHETVPLISIYHGLRFVFSDYRLPDRVREAGLEAIINYYQRVARIYRLDPRVPQRVLMDLGFEQMGASDYDNASATFTYFAERYEGNPIPLIALGDIRLARNDRAGAAAYFLEASRMIPKDPDLERRLEDLGATTAEPPG